MKVAVSLSLALLTLAWLPLQGAAFEAPIRFVGRLHLLLLHLPIGMLVGVAVLELLVRWRPSMGWDAACRALLWLTALSAAISSAAGVLLATEGGYPDDLMWLHRWLGAATAISLLWLLVLRPRVGSGNGWGRHTAYLSLLSASLVGMVAAGHYGASLTHGPDFLAKYAPWSVAAPVQDESHTPTEAESQPEVLAAPVQGESQTPAEAESQPEVLAVDVVDDHFAKKIQPVLQEFCYRCHGEKRQKGDLRIDQLDPDVVHGPDANGWHAALDMINSAEMPPADEPQMSDEQRRLVVGWMTEELEKAAIARQGERRAVLRRLTRAQYTNSLQDLLSVPINFGQVLPADGRSKMGFSNNGEVLQASTLHLDYYHQIARAGVEAALAVGPKPPITRYRITFGAGIGRGLVAGRTGGYQSVPLNPGDFTVDILDAEGQPVAPEQDEERKRLDGIRKRISIGLRGSSQDRFRVTDEGMMLLSALPHREKVPQSWQGPSPNVKLEMQRCWPEQGDFVMRVRAQRGYVPPLRKVLLVNLDEPTAMASLSADGELVVPEGAQVVAAEKTDQRKNLRLEDGVLQPIDVPEHSQARLRIQVPKDGFYQVDLVHPAVAPEAMPSIRLSLAGRHLDMRLQLTADELSQERVVTPLGVAGVRAGQQHLVVGGPFFTGFSHAVVTRLPDEHPQVRRLLARTDQQTEAVANLVPSIRAFLGTRTDDGMDYATFGESQEVRAPFGQPETYEFFGRLENLPIPAPESGDNEILSGFMLLGLWNDHLVKSAQETGPPLLVESIEFEAPYYPEWPPVSHTQIFFESPNQGDPEVYTREVLSRFMERAYRRPPQPEEVDYFMAFWESIRQDYDSYELGVAEALIAVLCSPSFLYVTEPEDEHDPDGSLSQPALATRLSLFLWNSPPDETLRSLAREGLLRDQLLSQVDRMLDDPRSWRFVRAFAREWLRLDRHEEMTINVDRHRDYTRFVKRDMAEETYHFVHRVLHEDLSIFTLIDSDFAMLNQNLAEFYGVEGVAGPHFRPVPVTKEQRRGGLLAQGSFLAGHSDGTEPHPIKRAVWLKEKILGDHPPPPPPNVPDLDPDTPGFEKMTLKQQLEVHRDNPSCRDCHARIDPYGVVFERYSAVGRFEGKRRGLLVDARSTLPDGAEIDGVDELKTYLLEQQSDAFARALTEHLFAYALGRDIHFGDDKELEQMLRQIKLAGYRARSVIRSIVASPSFTQP